MTTLKAQLLLALDPDGEHAIEEDAALVEHVRDLVAENERLRNLVSRSWTIVHKRARVVLPGDLVANESGKAWIVERVTTDAFETTIEMLASSSGKLVGRIVARDTAIPVLMPIPTRDGLVLLRGGLGAQLVPLQDDAADEGDPVAADPDRHGQVHTGACGAHPHVSLPGCTPG